MSADEHLPRVQLRQRDVKTHDSLRLPFEFASSLIGELTVNHSKLELSDL